MKTRNKKSDPVSRGDFLDGPDTMLWNPAATAVRCRGKTLRALTAGNTILIGLFGAGSLTLSIVWATGGAAVLFLAVGVIVLRSGGLAVAGALRSIATAHRHEERCRLQRAPGELFYRTKDFADLGPSTHDTVGVLIGAVAELTTTPVRGWLDPELPREVHRVVWDTLSCLDRTRSARALAAQLASEPGGAELAGAAAAAVEAIDTAVMAVMFHLQGCVLLTREWEAKLHHRALAVRTDTVLAALREIPLASVVETAESLPRSAFAHLTAARDVTGTGPFPWEYPGARVVGERWFTSPPSEHDRHHLSTSDTES